MYFESSFRAYHVFRMDSEDRYVIRPTGQPDRWCAWDIRRDEVVFGSEDLSEAEAVSIARRLNETYRRLDPQ